MAEYEKLTDDEMQELKYFLQDYVFSITEPSGKNFLCPLPGCGSGTGPKKTGAFSITKDGLSWKCFSCGKHGDIFDLYAEVNHTDLKTATGAIIKQYWRGAMRSKAPAPRKITPKPTQAQPDQPLDFSTDITKYADALPGSEAESYLLGRGFTTDTMRHFRLGYDAQRRAVTIPYDPRGSYYMRRNLSKDADHPHDLLKGVPIPLFNPGALYTSDVVFIVESPLCAISIAQAGGAAVAISGTSGAGRLLRQLEKKPTNATLALCLDNDEAGRKATDEIDAKLASKNIFAVNATNVIMGNDIDPRATAYRKDPNDVLKLDGTDALADAIADATEQSQQARAIVDQEQETARQDHTGATMVDLFLEAVQSKRYEPMPTGITDIDRAIGGGFIRQQLILLGAAPGVGKTALAQWIFERMAKRGTQCLYLNLEMSREQLLARSLARMAAIQGADLKATDILQGYKWTDAQRTAITAAANEYKATIADNIVYNPDGVNANLDTILAYIDAEAQRMEKINRPAPIICIDYLQLIGGNQRDDPTAVIKRAVAGLKDYAVRHNTIVFAIVAHNRDANKTGNVTLESGRDTSALEYSADLQLALTYTKCLARPNQTPKRPEELTMKDRHEITLKIVKARFGEVGKEVDLYFNGISMTQLTHTETGVPDWVTRSKA